MSAVLASYSIKGGVGKTSAAVNLAVLAARDGLRTLLWDLDPQGASTYVFRVKPKVRGGARKLVRLRSDVEALLRGTDHEGLDLLPSDFSYRHMDLELDQFRKSRRRLGRVLEPLAGEYDCVFLDCPPSISLVSESVFEACDALLVPVVPTALSARTFDQLAEVVDGTPALLAFFSMVDGRRELHREVMSGVRAAHGRAVLGAAIPVSDQVERMGSERDAVVAFAPDSPGALAYRALWWDLRRRFERTMRTLPGR